MHQISETMIDFKRLEQDSEYKKAYYRSLKNRREDTSTLDRVVQLNEERKKLVFQRDTEIANRRKIERDFSNSKDSALLKKTKEIGSSISKIERELRQLEEKISEQALLIPNICHTDVPVSEKENKIIRQFGKTKSFSFTPRSHIDLTQKKGIDFERASKVTGARFSFLTGEIAHLERALAQFMLDTHIKKNKYKEIHAPFILNDCSLQNTGQLPKFEEDLFKIKDTSFYLLPTAEVPLTNFFAGEILNEEDLPIQFVSYSPCFRAEAGSYGKDVKGLMRQHQFTKVELVILAHPEQSYEQLEKLTEHAEMILQDLDLPYRVVSLCTGDIGFSATKCYDIEVWIPFENTYREISSCSNCEDFQSRRASIRFRSKQGSKPRFIHTLNGSGLAVGRTLIALLENHQNEDGSVSIPKKLQPYMDGKKTILS